MRSRLLNIVYRSLIFYRRQAFFQLVIIAILASVITGSLLTGYSVRKSLGSRVSEKLGKSDLVISSGDRFFLPSLGKRIEASSGTSSTYITDINAICQNFVTGDKVLRAKVTGIADNFFEFNGYGNIRIEEGSVAINTHLAEKLSLKKGDEIILTLNPVSDIPASSPFAPSSITGNQSVFRVSSIIPADSCGNFSLDISQAVPFNIFIRNEDLFSKTGGIEKANNILVENPGHLNSEKISGSLRNSLTPEDIGLHVRLVEKSRESEVTSTRVFLDGDLTEELKKALPEARPLLTYLVNTIGFKGKETPYSFVSALTDSTLPGFSAENSIIINRWLSEDLGAGVNDTLLLTWYNPGKISDLEETSGKFIISAVIEMSGIGADSLLMPQFPGISGKESCSDWDAGVDIKMDRIRKKDEDYWNKYKGTPKAFIAYEKGEKIWGSNFGPATGIRWNYPANPGQIVNSLKGKIDPLTAGFSIRDIRSEMISAAKESVDFSTLFLSLGFFIIVSTLFLLVLAVKSWFETRKEQVYTLNALGFKKSYIRMMLSLETGLIAFSGSILGVVAGLFVNLLIINALNSVWMGAVQTNTLSAFPGIMPMVAGFFSTLIISLLVLYISTTGFLKRLTKPVTGEITFSSPKMNLVFLVISAVAATLALFLYFSAENKSAAFSFSGGGLVFISLILLWRQMILGGRWFAGQGSGNYLSASYYRFHPGSLLMPVLLIAAGLFAVVITGINRMQAGEGGLKNSGGTGGYQIWAETTVPVKEDIGSSRGIKTYGLDEFEGKFTIVQAKRSSGDDASCLNLNHVTSPALLGLDPSSFISDRSFSFASLIKDADRDNPWEIITRKVNGNVIYGFADQTVLEWGLKKKTGDTLLFRSESGELFRLVIAGGLKSSLFQGYVVTDSRWISELYPSISGSSVFLIKCEYGIMSSLNDAIRTRFEPFGISTTPAVEKLEEFFQVTNTYLSVFTVLGGFGIILGVIGLGFVLRLVYNSRRREFALMMASGFTGISVRRIILKEQLFILFAGISTGLISGTISTLPSITSGGEIQWLSLFLIISAMVATGLISLLVSMQSLKKLPLTSVLRRE
jgi:ABC-type antimicrobial peptide transport system permease subunit